MSSKIMIAATVAALSLATTAFAAEGGRPPAQWQQPNVTARFDNTVLPALGSEGAVQSVNSLPPGALDGTAQQLYAQSANRWFAQQADHRFARQALGQGQAG